MTVYFYLKSMQHQFCHIHKRILKTNFLPFIKTIRCLSTGSVPKRVYLHNFHAEKNARFVDFAGFLMPLQYSDFTLTASHKHTREHVSIFDVTHMLQSKISGKDKMKFIESLVVSDIEGLNVNQGTLTVFTNDKGGIIDDLIVTKTDEDYLYVVSNAGCIDKDLSHMNKRKEEFKRNGADIELEVIKDKVLLAIQGPGTAKILQEFVEHDLNNLTFMTTTKTTICGVDDCRITRCGYTGEDGVEISIPAAQSELILKNLLNSKKDEVMLAGLGARDTLRLEAGLCLYGNDITDETTPIEAGLAWTIGKRRRETGGFPGDSIILKQLKEKPKKKRVGFLSVGPCPRASTKIMNLEGDVIGTITSGCPSPCLKKNISMGYVDSAFSKIGNKIKFLIHKKEVEGTVAKMPFVPSKYYVK
ncbi:aminomethyltransferase, mitochondrial [Parasteatoda tepidariorum]|uniref:aminomethyltransferase, mitochondrial n=1 Tax=Parasteatoda tepidariorum TaxID=114398 RepID=UPI001C71C9CC|nr:aminomethyltransferase, mitochondrial [Parasteatoda tepidariorum]